jgi:hypothetical protein
VEDPAHPGRKAQWLRDMTALLATRAYRQFRAALYWDDQHSGIKIDSACEFDYRTSPGALAAWRSMALTPAFAARSACVLGDCLVNARRSRLPVLTGGATAAFVMGGLAAYGIQRKRRAVQG